MQSQGGRQLTWSIRHGAPGAFANRVLADVARSCGEICRAHLPEARGYEVETVRLSGPVEGASLRIRRGNFRATISVQRFEQSAGHRHRQGVERTLRLVASAEHTVPEEDSAQSRTATYWTATGGATGTMAVGIVALALTGGITAWGSALLLVPALFGTRVCMALWMADNMRQKALLPADETGATKPQTRSERRDLQRWQAVLDELNAQHEATAERFSLRPFRGISTGSHRALTDGTVEPDIDNVPARPLRAQLNSAATR